MSSDRDFDRLRWRCRRGTRELDALLGDWLEKNYHAADPLKQAAFAALLDQQDPELWHWLMGQGAPDDPQQCAIINEIRAHHHS